MTQAELDALPEDGPFWMEEVVIDGRTVRRLMLRTAGALWVGDNDPIAVTDVHGQRWFVGRAADGQMYKRRSHGA